MSNLPDNGGYVAAAYLVFFALVLIYLSIMATKLARIEREIREITDLAPAEGESRDVPPAAAGDS